jgi:hypothetical protein
LNPSTGAITGTPTAEVSAEFTVTVSDSAEPEAEAELELSIEITLPSHESAPQTLPGGTLEKEYEQEVVATRRDGTVLIFDNLGSASSGTQFGSRHR